MSLAAHEPCRAWHRRPPPGRAILSGVSLDPERGAFVGPIGPNGAGKTTLPRALAGLLPPTGGTVRLDGRVMDATTCDERPRRIAALFQGAGIGWPMATTGVAPLAHRTEPTLSSGERRRVPLARALAVEAEWLLADEPITALDPGHQLDAMALLRSAARSGAGVVSPSCTIWGSRPGSATASSC